MGEGLQEFRPGQVFGHYRIVRLLGKGGMGAVYEATHIELSKQVALKTLLPDFAVNAELRTRFLREGKLAARLRHPHVVDVTDCGIEAGTPFLVMEYLEGEDLGACFERQGTVTPQRIADILVPIGAALATAHGQNIIHRDVKPQNIFLARSATGGEVAKILDFGISKVAVDGERLTGTMELLGSPAYMSPEQARSAKHVDARTDQYALGVILYEATTGEQPFSGSDLVTLLHAVIAGKFRRPRDLVPSLPGAFEALVLRSMSLSADHRFATTHDLVSALLPFASPRTQLTWRPIFASRLDTFIRPAEASQEPELSESRAPALGTARLASQQPPTQGLPAQSLPVRQGVPSIGQSTSMAMREAGLLLNPKTKPYALTLAAVGFIAGLGLVISSSRSASSKVSTSPVPVASVVVPVTPPIAMAPAPSPAATTKIQEGPPPGQVPLAPSPEAATDKPKKHRKHSDAATEASPAAPTADLATPPAKVQAIGPPAMGEARIITRISGKSQWAEVTIDGSATDRPSPLTQALAVGHHRIEAWRAGMGRAAQDVTVEAGKTLTVSLDLSL